MSEPIERQAELLHAEYTALRTEICQSIGLQHRILLTGYTVAAAIFGYLASSKPPVWSGLMAVPFVLLAMTSLWIVECNRMVRASAYIQHVLWPEMKRTAELSADCDVGWEAWIRDPSTWPSHFCTQQDRSQRFVVTWIPTSLSFLSIFAAVTGSFHEGVVALLIFPAAVAAVWLWYGVSERVAAVSDLKKSEPPNS